MPELNRIYLGDCIEVMKTWPENFVDTIITDPPYGLDFMGKDWDGDVPGVHFWQEMIRISKPGAMLLAFGGTRTWHHLAIAIEKAGWQIRDCLMWLYGSGFPKSLDISKAIDKAAGAEREVVGQHKQSIPQISPRKNFGQRFGDEGNNANITIPATDLAHLWSGWGTALKPAWEPIIVAMKPLDGTFAENAERWGVAGLNVDGGRIPGAIPVVPQPKFNTTGAIYNMKTGEGRNGEMSRAEGRWPANLLLDEDAAAMLDGQSGNLHQAGNVNLSDVPASPMPKINRDSGGGASRFFYVAKSARAERNEGCEEMPEQQTTDSCLRTNSDSARKYQANSALRKNHHPTVKPLELMKYLCNLTRTPTGGIVLDPFAGSGTTLWAAECHNRPWIGIEMNPEYVAIAEARIKNERAQSKMSL